MTEIGSELWSAGNVDHPPRDPLPMDDGEGLIIVGDGDEDDGPQVDDQAEPRGNAEKKPRIKKSTILIVGVAAAVGAGLIGYQQFKQRESHRHISPMQQAAMMGSAPNKPMQGLGHQFSNQANPMGPRTTPQTKLTPVMPGTPSSAAVNSNTKNAPNVAMPQGLTTAAPTAMPKMGAQPLQMPKNSDQDAQSSLPDKMTAVPTVTRVTGLMAGSPASSQLMSTSTSMSLPKVHQIIAHQISPTGAAPSAGSGDNSPHASHPGISKLQSEIDDLIKQSGNYETANTKAVTTLSKTLNADQKAAAVSDGELLHNIQSDHKQIVDLTKIIDTQSAMIGSLSKKIDARGPLDTAKHTLKTQSKKPEKSKISKPKIKAKPKMVKYNLSATLPHWHLTAVSRAADQIISPNGTTFTVRQGEKFHGLGIVGVTTPYHAASGVLSYELRTSHGVILPKITN